MMMSRDNHKNSSSRSSSSIRHARQAAADLAFLVSSSKPNRQTLLLGFGGILRTGEDSALQAILDLLASLFASNTAAADEEEEKTMMMDGPILQSMAMVAYFLSLDCTLSGATSPKTARRLRLEFLTQASALQGLVSLVRWDPLLATLRKPSDEVAVMMVDDDAAEDDQVSLNSSSSLASSSSSVDPTKAGRRRRKQQRLLSQQSIGSSGLSVIPEHQQSDVSSDVFAFPSQSLTADSDARSVGSHDDSHHHHQALKILEQMERASARMMESMPNATQKKEPHVCGCGQNIALMALTHIITGKSEGDDKSCMDDDASGDEFLATTTTTTVDNQADYYDDDDDDDEPNPLLKTNRMLEEAGVVPLLSAALAETLAAVIHQLDNNNNHQGGGSCSRCVDFLHDRVISLISLVDGACLLHASNRQTFCEEGYTREAGGCLIIALAAVLKTLTEHNKLFREGAWGDIGLEALRALTSLTHENEIASQELKVMVVVGGVKNNGCCGMAILVNVLYTAVECRPNGTTGGTKLRYDSIIFCLNCFANCVESDDSTTTTSLLGQMKLPTGGHDEKNHAPFLTWLTRWLVNETGSFREAVEGSTFGSSPTKHSERRLEKDEDERLVTAGNGFVLLACLMIHSSSSEEETGTTTCRDLILAELPGDQVDSKLTYVKNTLKAFCNFYHFSIGDLSVAVVDPVRKLMAQL